MDGMTPDQSTDRPIDQPRAMNYVHEIITAIAEALETRSFERMEEVQDRLRDLMLSTEEGAALNYLASTVEAAIEALSDAESWEDEAE